MRIFTRGFSALAVGLAAGAVAVNASMFTHCLNTFERCARSCSSTARSEFSMHQSAPKSVRSRLCIKSCAKESAQCQEKLQSPETHLPGVGADNDVEWHFLDALGKPTLPFGFYQYTIDERRTFRLPEEETVHGMSLSSPYVSTASPTESWFDEMEVRQFRRLLKNRHANSRHPISK